MERIFIIRFFAKIKNKRKKKEEIEVFTYTFTSYFVFPNYSKMKRVDDFPWLKNKNDARCYKLESIV
jgi:hypothetical protein